MTEDFKKNKYNNIGLTCGAKFSLQSLEEWVCSLATERTTEVIQIHGPYHGTSQLLLLQIVDLRETENRNSKAYGSNNNGGNRSRAMNMAPD